MTIFRSIIFVSVAAGLLVGLLTTAMHQIGAVPLILRAEVYEEAAAAPSTHDQASAATHEESHNATMEGSSHDHHDEAAWSPANGIERTFFTAAADVLTSIGFALLLTSAYVISGRAVNWREGLLWGLAGFAVFTLAPSLGLPPELPGMPAGELAPRQLWWIATALATAVGLVVIVYKRSPWAVAVGIGLLVITHVIGAPHAPEEASEVPVSLWRGFVIAVMLTSLLSWTVLGAVTGAFFNRRAA